MSPTHLTAVCGLVRRKDGKVLMNLNPNRGWEIPGGQVEAGETLIQALRREIQEETGVTAGVGALVGIYHNQRMSLLVFTFLCDYEAGEITTSDESLQTEWVDPAQSLARVEHPVVRMRLQDLLTADQKIMYRVYVTHPFEELETYRLNPPPQAQNPHDPFPSG
jgi:8-oxo-dGTP diphosphatase